MMKKYNKGDKKAYYEGKVKKTTIGYCIFHTSRGPVIVRK